jgi:hypothetical protein
MTSNIVNKSKIVYNILLYQVNKGVKTFLQAKFDLC